MAKKFYAVRKGRTTGIFETWDECKSSVEGYPMPQYKSFGSLNDAKDYLNGKANNIAKLEDISLLNKLVAYIDGSYDATNKIYSYGCVFITPTSDIMKISGIGDNPEAALINNVAGELKGALCAVKWAIDNGYKQIQIRHDYEGIAKWVTNKWQAKNDIVKSYVAQMNKYKDQIDIEFQKVTGHSNDTFNDEADKLARQALQK